MSITSAEPVVPAHLPEDPVPRPVRRWRASLKWVALVLFSLWAAETGVSLLIQHSRLNRFVTSRLEAAFGRPVQVGSYSFSLWTGPVLEANSVIVGEDARFGNEYFLRADSLSVRVRWLSVFTGHLELATISLSHPSLNLVRDAGGDWNLAEWLPRPVIPPGASDAAPGTRSAVYPLRFRRIDVDHGRINFKRGDEKLPFAFINVAGTAETEGPGRWRVDLTAVPSRAAVIVQQPGVLHVLGHLGGTSSRLRPAEFELSWYGASVTDVLRLARDRDYGLRGNFGIALAAHAEGNAWFLQGKAFLTELHRWDLALRADNPALNIVGAAALDATGSRLELKQTRIEMPHSEARVTGALDWTVPDIDPDVASPRLAATNTNRGSRLRKSRPSNALGTQLHISSDAVDLDDFLAWARAFHPGIADAAVVRGSAQLDTTLAGWPPRLETADLSISRAELRGPSLRVPVRFGPLLASFDWRKRVAVSETMVTFGPGANSFRVDAFAKPDASSFTLNVQGATAQLRDPAAAATLLGWNVARGWDIAGPARCDLHWQGTSRPWHTSLSGVIEWGTATAGVSLHPPFLNLPVEQIRARSEFHPDATHTFFSSAQAFGAHWAGTLDHDLSDGWQFAVLGDSVSTADLDRWLNPRWRESFIDRVLPFLNSRATAPGAPDGVRARGRLSLDEFALGRITVHRLRGDLSLDGRHLELSNLDAQFYRGDLGGSFDADLQPAPKYEIVADLSGVDLHAVAAEFPSLANLFTGSASANIAFNMQGTTRTDLVNSLQCHGTARLTDAAINPWNLAQSIRAEAPQRGTTPLRDASASFTCASGKIQFDDLRLSSANSQFDGAGTVTYTRNLDLLLHAAPLGVAGPRPAKLASTVDEYRITGSLEAPRFTHIPAAPVAKEKP